MITPHPQITTIDCVAPPLHDSEKSIPSNGTTCSAALGEGPVATFLKPSSICLISFSTRRRTNRIQSSSNRTTNEFTECKGRSLSEAR
jgi:hypothetical protein